MQHRWPLRLPTKTKNQNKIKKRNIKEERETETHTLFCIIWLVLMLLKLKVIYLLAFHSFNINQALSLCRLLIFPSILFMLLLYYFWFSLLFLYNTGIISLFFCLCFLRFNPLDSIRLYLLCARKMCKEMLVLAFLF